MVHMVNTSAAAFSTTGAGTSAVALPFSDGQSGYTWPDPTAIALWVDLLADLVFDRVNTRNGDPGSAPSAPSLAHPEGGA